MADVTEKCSCCGKIVQIIIFVASGFDAAILIGFIPVIKDMNDTEKGYIIQAIAWSSVMLSFIKLIVKESCVLCCKYYCVPYSLCCCNKKQIKSSKNVKSFWISYVDFTFDSINGFLLVNGYSAGTGPDFLVIAGTSIGVGSELLELISQCMECCYTGSCQLFMALIQAVIGIVQGVIALNIGDNTTTTTPAPTVDGAADYNDAGTQFTVYFSFYMYGIIIFAVLYAFCQINKAKKQEKTRKSTGQSVQMGVVSI